MRSRYREWRRGVVVRRLPTVGGVGGDDIFAARVGRLADLAEAGEGGRVGDGEVAGFRGRTGHGSHGEKGYTGQWQHTHPLFLLKSRSQQDAIGTLL